MPVCTTSVFTLYSSCCSSIFYVASACMLWWVRHNVDVLEMNGIVVGGGVLVSETVLNVLYKEVLVFYFVLVSKKNVFPCIGTYGSSTTLQHSTRGELCAWLTCTTTAAAAAVLLPLREKRDNLIIMELCRYTQRVCCCAV